MMEYSKKGRELTEQFEGCRLAAYQDIAGVWTIGYGHTSGVTEGMVCTTVQADTWLVNDIAFASAVVNREVTVSLTQGEFDALTDFVFNVGAGNLIHSTMLRKLNLGDYAGAAAEFGRWVHTAGQRVAGLMRRRSAEEAEFLG